MHYFINAVDLFNKIIAYIAASCAIVMTFAQVFSVVVRYVFSSGFIWVQESVVYGHAILFLFGAAYVLQTNTHVRVDIFYSQFGERTKRLINVAGLLLFVLPVAALIMWTSFPYVERAWSSLEGSRQAGGIPGVFLLKTAILVFAASLMGQAISTTLKLLLNMQDSNWESGEH